MNDHDPLDNLLHEWKSPAPPPSLDERLAAAYRASACPPLRRDSAWARFRHARVSIPLPALLAAFLILFALLYFAPPPPAPSAEPSGVLTRMNASGFQPLPNGEAHVIPVGEVQQ